MRLQTAIRSSCGSVITTRVFVTRMHSGWRTSCASPLDNRMTNGAKGWRRTSSRMASAFMRISWKSERAYILAAESRGCKSRRPKSPRRKPGDTGSHAIPRAMRCGPESTSRREALRHGWWDGFHARCPRVSTRGFLDSGSRPQEAPGGSRGSHRQDWRCGPGPGASGNNPGIHWEASAVGKANRNGARGEADVTTPCT